MLFCFANPLWANTPGNSCFLEVNAVNTTLTFFYTPHHATDAPYFYAKVLLEGQDIDAVTLDNIKDLADLAYLPPTDPHQYTLPPDAKKLYLVKSTKELSGFDPSASRIVPTLRPLQQSPTKARNASNYTQPLPKETLADTGWQLSECPLPKN